MKIFIFGAGASKAAQHELIYSESHPEKSPLADELFNEQYEKVSIEGINLNLSECKEKVKEVGSLEKWLSERWENINNLKTDRVRRAELGWFGKVNLYIWNLLNKISQTYPDAQGYTHLLRKLYDEDFGIISFNYDTLLDQSYEDVFHISLSNKLSYLRENFVKLHGSVNWFLKKRESESGFHYGRHGGDIGVRVRAIAENIYNGEPMNLDQLEILDPKHINLSGIKGVMDYFSNDGYFYPLIFMPLIGKDYSTVSNFKDVMLAKAEEMMRNASDIYLIGYQANDKLIHELMMHAPSKTKVHVIGLNSAKEIVEKIITKNPHLEFGTVYSEGFNKFTSTY